METYKEMYKELFHAVSKAIEALQEAQGACEEMFMESAEACGSEPECQA